MELSNRKAYHEYYIEDRYIAGMVLAGTEIKSLRGGKASTKRELKKLEGKIKEKGYSIIPLKIFISEKGYAKIEIGLAKGKKLHDKRDTIKERESDRDIKRKYGI